MSMLVSGSPRVALVGFYGQGNFGDDLMALVYGQYLKRRGLSFSVYKLCTPYAARFGFHVAQSAEELLEGADILLWGGGGLLVSWQSLTYRLLFPRVQGEFSALIDTARGKGVRFLASSVGGGGSCPEQLKPRYKQQFVESAEFITVRNPQDLDFVRRLGVEGESYPDILWSASEYLPVQPVKHSGLRIGVDAYFNNLLRQHIVQLLPLLYGLTRERKDCEFVLLDTTNRTIRAYRGLGTLIRGANVRSHQFTDPDEDLATLASLDLLVSTRLHSLLMCLESGVPVISLCGENKTRLLLENVGLKHLCFGPERIGEFIALMRSKPALDRFLRDYQFPDVAALARDSGGHLEALGERLNGGKPA
jgi:polysaccharide pyruvyl transferase WcaK-like protein